MKNTSGLSYAVRTLKNFLLYRVNKAMRLVYVLRNMTCRNAPVQAEIDGVKFKLIPKGLGAFSAAWS